MAARTPRNPKHNGNPAGVLVDNPDVTDSVVNAILRTASQKDVGRTLLNWIACHRSHGIRKELWQEGCKRYGIHSNEQARFLFDHCLHKEKNYSRLYPAYHPWETPRISGNERVMGVVKHGTPRHVEEMPLLEPYTKKHAQCTTLDTQMSGKAWEACFFLLSFISHWFDVTHAPRFEGRLRVMWEACSALPAATPVEGGETYDERCAAAAGLVGDWVRDSGKEEAAEAPPTLHYSPLENRDSAVGWWRLLEELSETPCGAKRWAFPANLLREVCCGALYNKPQKTFNQHLILMMTNQTRVGHLVENSGKTETMDMFTMSLLVFKDKNLPFGLNPDGMVRTSYPASGTSSTPSGVDGLWARRATNQLASRTSVEPFRKLVDMGANLLLGDPNDFYRTPLMSLAKTSEYVDNHVKLGMYLTNVYISRGYAREGYLDACDGLGYTALHYACDIPQVDLDATVEFRRRMTLCRFSLIKRLLEASACPLVLSASGETPSQVFERRLREGSAASGDTSPLTGRFPASVWSGFRQILALIGEHEVLRHKKLEKND